ncbi:MULTISPECIES: GNAT family N-acetyltransferase [unclassified Prochlorococcus]|uniref:GNAT family N-acetyltransferase n=1 Tax=unclassified Prochlorococcus TaxID=2627481 RepID=UPI0005337ECA|nr:MULTISPECIES: GNAT family N-acetyltransferase [unclassified Prochlorococcus]KGG16831.1 hypothetical protein EV06_0675 [Prochlorococcus sp. MIT 0602]KGG18195.1 hypothetical protein EV07_0109 [Prochlorococcus sp. MIT 0603]
MKSLITPSWHHSIEEVSEQQWDGILGKDIIPFYQWKWLHALEKSDSISAKYGWIPLHLTLWEKGKLIALAPLYLKNHSYGEFIFDQSIVRLSAQLGLKYYPKLIGMSPLSPIEGYRFFIADDKDKKEITKIIMENIDKFAEKNGILSCNFLYVDQRWMEYGEVAEWSCWINTQTEWKSIGEKSFDDYLARFNSNQRRNIKRERKSIKNNNIKISVLNGKEIDLKTMRIMHNFYANHCLKWGEWGSKYLTSKFFEELSDNDLKSKVVLFNAYKDDPKKPIAMSLCITDWTILWGRYWGCKEEIQNLHFELCYYSPISWAIEKGIKRFDPGAGGNHKFRRGFQASQRFSLHRWYDKRLDSIMNSLLPEANQLMKESIIASNNELPFKH